MIKLKLCFGACTLTFKEDIEESILGGRTFIIVTTGISVQRLFRKSISKTNY